MYGNDLILTHQQEIDYQHLKQYNFTEDFQDWYENNPTPTKEEIVLFCLEWEYKSRELWLKEEFEDAE